MAKPTQSIFPIENGKLITALDCNNLQLLNLDTSNLSVGGGGGGNDTGTTTAILKGDGNHGFADAVAGTDYATPAALAVKENSSDHATDIITVTDSVTALAGTVTALTATVGTKADDAATTTALGLKADDADLQAYITSNDAAVAVVVGNVSTLTTDLGNKADSASVSAALAGKEPTLPTTVNDNYILARRNASGTNAWFFVDPVTLGTTSQTFTDGQSFTNTNYDSATANFVAGDIGKTITGTNIPASTTISSRTSATRVVLSQATTGTGGPGLSFTIINRLIPASSGGTVTTVSLTNNITSLFTGQVNNPTTSPEIVLTPQNNIPAFNFYGNETNATGFAHFMTPAQARVALGGTTAGQALFQLANPSAISYPRINADNTVTARTPAQTLIDLGAESALTFSAPLARATNTISIPAATTSVPGHLTAADWTTFNNKVASTRSIGTTAPLIGGGDLSANRTFSIPAATATVNGYLAGADFATFTAKPPNTRTISTTAPLTGGGDLSANRTLAIAAATNSVDGYLKATDFAAFAGGSEVSVLLVPSGLPPTPATYVVSVIADPPVKRVVLNVVLTQALTITLPSANLYGTSAGYPSFEIVDTTGGAMANFGIIIAAAAGDSVDNVTTINMARGSGYQRFTSNGANKWFSISYSVNAFIDPTTPSRRIIPTVSPAVIGTQGLTINPDSLTVVASVSDTSPAVPYRSQFACGVGVSGAIIFDRPIPDASTAEGQLLTVIGGVPTWGGATSPWQQLTPAAGSVPWAPLPGQRIQNGYVTLNQNAILAVSSTNLSSGMEFNLLLIQDGTGGKVLTPPVGTIVGGNGLGIIPQNTAANVKEWHRFNYSGITGFTWLHGLMATNMTGIVVAACNTAGTVSATSGTAGLGIGSSSGLVYVANTFVATESAVCRIDAGLYNFGATFTLKAAIYTDIVRPLGTAVDGATTSGAPNLTASCTFAATDVGQRITVSAGYASTDLFIQSFIDATHVTVATTKGGAAINATSSLTNLTVNVYGRPGTQVGTASTNNPSATSLPIYSNAAAATAAGFPGAPNGNDNPTSFTGLSCVLTPSTTYHCVLNCSVVGDVSHTARWLYSSTQVGAAGYNMLTSANGTSWSVQAASPRKMLFTLYHS